MPIKKRALNDKPPVEIKFYWQDDQVTLGYYPGRMTDAWRNTIRQRTLRQSLASILSHWDVEGDDGQAYQPPPLSNVAHWQSVIDQADATIEQDLPLLPEGPHREALQNKYHVSRNRLPEARYADARTAAWERLLAEIGDDEFIIACINAISDDFLGDRPASRP